MNEFKIEGNRVWSLRFRNTKIREIMDLGVCLKRERKREGGRVNVFGKKKIG